MQGIDLTHSNEPTYSVGSEWKAMTNAERIGKVMTILGPYNDEIDIMSARPSGQIVLSLKGNKTAAERGEWLMQCETHLKNLVDHGLTIWLEPKGDRNILRAQTRGIVMKEW